MPKRPGADRWQTVIAPRCSACLLFDVSWLLVCFIPGLLMLATFGLQRLEAGLVDDSTTGRRADIPERTQIRRAPLEYAGLPTRPATSQRVNPQFPATRQANRV